MDHLQGKLSTRPEPAESSAPLGNKGAGTQSGNEPSSTPVPEMKVSFNTQEKMAWNTKRRYESLMVAKIKPLLTRSSKNVQAVEVIGVGLWRFSLERVYMMTGAHYQERPTPILSLCHGIFTDRFIFRLFVK